MTLKLKIETRPVLMQQHSMYEEGRQIVPRGYCFAYGGGRATFQRVNSDGQALFKMESGHSFLLDNKGLKELKAIETFS